MTRATPSFWTPASFARITSGRWLVEPDDMARPLNGVGIDSRALRAGEVFVALSGERFDGHDFVEDARTAGAAFAIVERPIEGDGIPTDGSTAASLPLLRVPSSLAALQALAQHYRDVLQAGGCRVVSVSGSNGKTTTRHLIHHILTRAGRIGSQSPRSFNNHLGVPLTLLAARPGDDFLACEIGTNHPSEIAALAALVRPDIAVVTSIGEEHLEFLVDLAGVVREESALLNFVQPGGTALLPDPSRLPLPIECPPARSGARPEGTRGAAALRIQRFNLDPIADALPLPGEHNRLNASAAAALARLFGIDDRIIAAALSDAAGMSGRTEILFASDGTRPTIINDAYNANPTSMRAALAMLREERPGHGVAILGDMLELGDAAPAAHRAIAETALRVARCTVLIGPRFADAVTTLPAALAAAPGVLHVHREYTDAVAAELAALLEPRDLVLLKGSRAMALERLVPAIERRFDAV